MNVYRKIYDYSTQLMRVLSAVLFCIMLCLAPHTLWAKTSNGLSQDVQDRAIRIAQIIESIETNAQTAPSQDSNALATDRSDYERLKGLRIRVGDSLSERTPDDLSALNAQYSLLAKQIGANEDIAIARIVELYMTIKSKGPNHESVAIQMKELREMQMSDQWFIANRALQIEAILQARAYDLSTALRLSQKALKIIPDTVSHKTLEASYEVNSVIGTVYFMLGNFELGLQATEDIISQGQKIGRDIDGITLLNNLIFCADRWQEPELAADLSRISLNLIQGQGGSSEVIAHFRYGQALNKLQRYSEALPLIDRGLSLAVSDNWRINLQLQRAISYAGLGDEAAAKAAFNKVLIITKGNPRYDGKFKPRKYEIDALIAASQGRARDVLTIMTKMWNVELQNMLRLQSADTLKLTALVDNSKAVQEANEATYLAETALKQKTITAQKKRLDYFTIITIMFAAMLIAALAFLLHQRRSAKVVAALKDKALAGEEAKSQFLAVMSHELRTPLNGIIGLAEILSRESSSADVRFKNGIILKSGYTLLDLLTNILDMSKMETGKLSITPIPTDVRDIVTTLGELWLPQAQKQGLTFTCFVADNVPARLSLDGMRLRQCLENLVSNSIKFTRAGRVHVHVTYETRMQNHTGTLRVIVADTGQGMTEEKCQEVFEPFTQADTTISRSHGGSGLGLAITRSLSRLMGGDTVVTSAINRGSEFTLTLNANICSETLDNETLRPSVKQQYLLADSTFNKRTRALPPVEPVDDNAQSLDEDLLDDITAELDRAFPAETASLAPPSKPRIPTPSVSVAASMDSKPKSRAHSSDPFRSLKVLIVEDVTSNQEVLKIFLEPVGCIVTCASNGHEALAAMQHNSYDVVLMDIRMPEMDGIEATLAIRSQEGAPAHTPIIALTADASAENNAQCMAAGADVFLTKPVVASELFGSIRFVLNQAKWRADDKLERAQSRTG